MKRYLYRDRMLTINELAEMSGMVEVWKAIEDYEGIYEVSNLGRVRSLDRVLHQRGARGHIITQTYRGKVLQLAANGRYLTVSLNYNGKQKTHAVHRLVANAFIPNPTNLPYINHKDENKHNNRVDNLEWCTISYNAKYGTLASKKSNRTRGEGNPCSKLTVDDIRNIRQSHLNGIGNKVLAEEYGVSSDHIYQIVTRRRWKHIV